MNAFETLEQIRKKQIKAIKEMEEIEEREVGETKIELKKEKKSRFERLKEAYPEVWEKIARRFFDEKARKKAFMAEVALMQAKQLEKEMKAKNKRLQRKRRTRALILFAYRVLELAFEYEEYRALVNDFLKNERLVAKEGNKEIDYLQYLKEEIKEIKKRIKEKES